MECHISDGPQLPEDIPGYDEPDGDALHDEQKQREVDNYYDEQRDLSNRLSAAVLHIAQHHSFPERKLVRLLKDVNRHIRR